MKINKSLPQNICALPWTSVHYRPTGVIAPCCDFDLDDMFVGTNVEEYKNSNQLKKVKQQFLKGKWPKGCDKCKKQEEQTGHSRRLQESNNYLGHIEAEELTPDNLLTAKKYFYLNLGLNNKCNLGCIMCNTANSSYLLREQAQNSAHFLNNIDHRKEPNKKNESYKVVNPWSNDWGPTDVEDLINTIDNDHGVKSRITFHGGEPTIMKEPYEILNAVKEKGWQEKIIIEFNSNFQQYNPKWFDALKGFEGHALISLDAIGTPGEYIRYPSKWETVEKNILRFKEEYSDQFRITVCPTLQITNILYIEELIDWCYANDIGLTLNGILESPSHLAINNLPELVKEDLIEKLKNKEYQQSFGRDERPNIINLLKQQPVRPLKWTRNYLEKVDGVRGTNWKKSLPKLWKAFKS